MYVFKPSTRKNKKYDVYKNDKYLISFGSSLNKHYFDKIGYYSNGLRRSDKWGVARTFYTQTFSYTFEYPNDTVYFAYSYPYTYTDMIEDLNRILTDPIKS